MFAVQYQVVVLLPACYHYLMPKYVEHITTQAHLQFHQTHQTQLKELIWELTGVLQRVYSALYYSDYLGVVLTWLSNNVPALPLLYCYKTQAIDTEYLHPVYGYASPTLLHRCVEHPYDSVTEGQDSWSCQHIQSSPSGPHGQRDRRLEFSCPKNIQRQDTYVKF